MRVLVFALAIVTIASLPAWAGIDVVINYLQQEQERPPVLSNLDAPPETLGIDGAQLGLLDNKTTGGFLGHAYQLNEIIVPIGGDLEQAAREALAVSPLLVLDMPAADVLKIADMAQSEDALLINIAANDTALRGRDCRANLLHSLPSLAMRADALMQFALAKRWDRLALVAGAHDEDTALADAFRNSAQKFGLKIRNEKIWKFDADLRRSASGEVPVFTQELGEYDLLLIADARDDFGRYIPYNTWLARPVAGSEGVVPNGWAPVVEQWGAAQLQSRFTDQASRLMHPKDYAAWAAIRAVGEAVTRTNTADATDLRAYMLSDDFALAGFLGRPLSFRQWNGQLRQPIPLTTPRAMVAQAPLPGYLHQRNELDTLGIDLSESECEAYK